jgi:hypothetical protein
MNKKLLSDFAQTLLFENNINELRLPLDHDMDAGKNNRTSALDQPGPQIDGNGNYQSSFEDIVDLPLTADDMMANHQIAAEKIDADSLRDENYLPTNQSELIKATSSLLSNIDLEEKDMKRFWTAISKFLNKRAD